MLSTPSASPLCSPPGPGTWPTFQDLPNSSSLPIPGRPHHLCLDCCSHILSSGLLALRPVCPLQPGSFLKSGVMMVLPSLKASAASFSAFSQILTPKHLPHSIWLCLHSFLTLSPRPCPWEAISLKDSPCCLLSLLPDSFHPPPFCQTLACLSLGSHGELSPSQPVSPLELESRARV